MPRVQRSQAETSNRRMAAIAVLAIAASAAGYGLFSAVHGGSGASTPARDIVVALDPATGLPPSFECLQTPTLLPTAADALVAPVAAADGEPWVSAGEEALPEEIYERPRIEGPPREENGPQQLAMLPQLPAGVATPELPAWRRHAAVPPDARGRPMIAIVIDDLGIDAKRTARAVALPPPLTLSFLPDGADLPAQGHRARARGHELLVHVGMEAAVGGVDPGSHALRTGQTSAELRARLSWNISRLDGYVGVNNHMGSRFTADYEAMSVVMAEIGRRGLLFLDSRTTAETVAARAALAFGVPFAERNVFLDPVGDTRGVESRLSETERVARRNGFAVAIGHPRDATLEALAVWLATLADRGFAQVPLTAIVASAMER
jgi:hypothetical protein